MAQGDISVTEYAFRRKELLTLVNQLRTIGAQGDLDLPRIAVIGNQSAGKSSVVEAISGINVPRDAGTCTRCPMECRLSASAGPWSCRISIRFEYDDEGAPLGEVAETPFGDAITEKSEVEPMLRRAQLAVLNPTMTIAEILNIAAGELREGPRVRGRSLLFSRNVVCVDLEGPELTDLAFIDLPGLIQNAEPETVRLVEDLVVSHIKGNCLILVAIPTTDDIENQKALRLARKEDPQGRRTIGVMTKPDMLTAGSTKARDLWMDVIEGRRHQLHHGYYCTRHPDDAERSQGITASEARAAEVGFFSSGQPWSASSHQKRLGTANLVSALSALLIQVINESLPKIRTEALARLDDCRRELSALPAAIGTEPATHLLMLLTGLCDDVQQYIRGGGRVSRLVHDNRDAYAAFKRAVRSTAPNFVPVPDAGQGGADEVRVLEGDGEEPAEGLVSMMKPMYLNDMRKHIKRSMTRELPGNVPFEAKIALITASQETWKSSVRKCFDRVLEAMVAVLIECVDQRFQRHELLRGRLQACVTEIVAKHYDMCNAHLQAVLEMELTPFTQNTHYLETCADKWLARYRDARAARAPVPVRPWPQSKEERVLPTVARFPTNVSTSTSWANDSGPFSFGRKEPKGTLPRSTNIPAAGLFETPKAEAPAAQPGPSKPFWDQPGFSQSVLAAPSITLASFGNAALAPQGPQSVHAADGAEKTNQILALLAELGLTGLTKEDLGKLNPPDEFEAELKIMAEVRGYFQVSYKRIIDSIPMMIDLHFVKAVGKDLQAFLISRLELGAADAAARCAAYLAEEPVLVARREELTAKRRRLETVRLELYKFGL